MQIIGRHDRIKNVTEDTAQPAQDSGGDGDGPSEDDLENSRKNIREFVNGRKKFKEVIDDYAKLYAEKVNSNKKWSWDEIPYSKKLTARKRRQIKARAVELGEIPHIPKKPGTNYADFEKADVIYKIKGKSVIMMLPKFLWKASDRAQFKWLDSQLPNHTRPSGYTWHHSEIEGRMELIPYGIHNITHHYGGRSKGKWAAGKR